ncbi:hypothetical protein BWI15_31815 [Kribbella sp. ALI-6-A]|uniref:hypothetical protein n=1 Tax=Kribbella sp. ALI-6-A TaxID=1933817 RepID=UPI00097BD1AC|nr:hypothetical protein [Kribbella sp. ALI-6-A]ONI67686.1 hypothetical protein BWI15_31815 [Kribbella sp. ALI-6-A]
MSGRVIASKAANYLVEDAALRDGALGPAFDLLDISTKPVEQVLATFRQHYNGLWVGGRATLTDTEVTLAPNALNRSIHEELNAIELPLAMITSVEVEFGWLTKIIALGTPTHVVKLRCFGAHKLAGRIRAQLP